MSERAYVLMVLAFMVTLLIIGTLETANPWILLSHASFGGVCFVYGYVTRNSVQGLREAIESGEINGEIIEPLDSMTYGAILTVDEYRKYIVIKDEQGS